MKTRIAPDIQQSPHSMLHLFTHRKAYDISLLSGGGGPCFGGNPYQITVG